MRGEAMERNRWVWAFCGVLFVILSPTWVGATESPSACIVCHQGLAGELARPVTDWRDSIHQQNDITCDLCHGGDAEVEVGNPLQLSGVQFAAEKSAAMSRAQGFIGKPAGLAMFDMCANCHPDSVARYAASIMGKAYLEDKGGPSCVTCHNAHNNFIPVVPKSCTPCHKDTSGFDQIDPMQVTAATLQELSGLRVRLAEQQTRGHRPPLFPALPAELDSYLVGLLAFGAVVLLLIVAYLIIGILERKD